ncbi:MAG: CocE/NonD family hydrolase C-terminal non-catalytic domain-containing protein, partial [Actinomycetota bacterium]
AKRSKIPLFLTQGFIETNTKPDAAFDFWNGLSGTENRAWFGQFDHWRGWEKNEAGKYYTGRKVFMAEVMRFFDQHLKGKSAATQKDPSIAVQDILGRYRAEVAWPPADSKTHWTELNVGTYSDDRSNTTLGGRGLWSVSQTLPHDVWLSGEPVVEVTADAFPRSNVVVNLYDIAPNGDSLPISRGTMMFRDEGSQTVRFDMYGQDAPIDKGHRIGVLISGANTDWWGLDVPTNQEISVDEARIGLPFLTFARTRFLDGKITPDLRDYRSEVAATSKGTIKNGAAKFSLPGPLRKR